MRDETIGTVRMESKRNLPPGLSVGVIPPDGTQLSLSIWMQILEIDETEKDAFRKQLQRDGIEVKPFCRNPFIDSTHFRRVIFAGKNGTE